MLTKLKVRFRIPFLKVALAAPPWFIKRFQLGLALNENEPLEQKLRWFLKLQSLDPLANKTRTLDVERQAFVELGDSYLSGPKYSSLIKDAVISGEHPIPIRMYRPLDSTERLPAILWIHGGGWVIGDLETHDRFCRRLCRETKSLVIGVDYRRAPEVVFPAPIDDVTRVWRWIKTETDCCIDSSRLASGEIVPAET